MDGKEVLLLQVTFPTIRFTNYLQVSPKLASLLLRRLRGGWAQPPALTCSHVTHYCK